MPKSLPISRLPSETLLAWRGLRPVQGTGRIRPFGQIGLILVIRSCPLCGARLGVKQSHPRPPRAARATRHPVQHAVPQQRLDERGSPSSRHPPSTRPRQHRHPVPALPTTRPRCHQPTTVGAGYRPFSTARNRTGDPATEPPSGCATRSHQSPGDDHPKVDHRPGRTSEHTAPAAPTGHRSSHDDHAPIHHTRTHAKSVTGHALVDPSGPRRPGGRDRGGLRCGSR